MSKFTQLLTVRLLELEASELRDEAILKRRVVYVVTKIMRMTYFLGFIRAEPRDNETGPAVAGAPTHIEEVLGVLEECTNADAK